MNQPRQFRLPPKEIAAIRRNGTLRRDLQIAEWMQRSQPYGEYRATTDAFMIVTPTGDLQTAPYDCVIPCAGRFSCCTQGRW
jgi:hypothetical protein